MKDLACSCSVADAPVQGRLPALGWNSWNAYHCDVSEAKILAAANQVVDLGLKDAGYEYVNSKLQTCRPRSTADNAKLTTVGLSRLVVIPQQTRSFPMALHFLMESVARPTRYTLSASSWEFIVVQVPRLALGTQQVSTMKMSMQLHLQLGALTT